MEMLKPNLLEGADYKIISEPSWRALVSWYVLCRICPRHLLLCTPHPVSFLFR